MIVHRRRTARGIGQALVFSAIWAVLLARSASAQGLTGTMFGTLEDQQGAALAEVTVRLTSSALIGGELTSKTNANGQWRFPSLPPGVYVLDIELQGFQGYRERDLQVWAGAAIERPIVLALAAVAQSVVVEAAGSRIDARDPGLTTRFGPDDLARIPTRRASMFDFIRATPGISPTSPGSGTTGSGTTTTVSAFGSATNENQFLIDGTNFTCPCNGVARSEPGIDFIQEIQVQSIGASAEYGNVQGAVINVIAKQGGERFLYDAAYYAQANGLTSQPVRLTIPNSNGRKSGYERDRYRDFTTSLGGPVVSQRLWFFAGYQHVRDYDSQPGADPGSPRKYEQDKGIAKLNVAARTGLATRAEHSLRLLGQPRSADGDHSFPGHAEAAGDGARDDLRPPHPHLVQPHGVGCPGRPLRLYPGEHSEHG